MTLSKSTKKSTDFKRFDCLTFLPAAVRPTGHGVIVVVVVVGIVVVVEGGSFSIHRLWGRPCMIP